MQKFLQLLEKNVEWIALSLGGLFLLWMLYGYVVQKPVKTTVAGVEVTPGEVDAKTKEGPATKLRIAMDDPRVPKMQVANFLDDLQKQLSGADTAIASAFNGLWVIGMPHMEIDASATPKVNVDNAVAQVTQLPQPPSPTDLKVSQGRSNVMIPPPGGAAGGATGTGTPADRNWVTVSANIPIKALAAEIDGAKIPSPLNTNVTLLRVEMIRQEQDTNGNWSAEQTLPPLQNVTLQPFPIENATPSDGNGYQTWAEKTQGDLLQPPFYQVLQADPWLIPGSTPPPPPAEAVQAFDPAKVTNPTKLNPEERKLYEDWRKQEAARKKQEQIDRYRANHPQRTPGGPPPGGSGLGGPGAPGYAPIDTGRPMTLAQAAGRPPYTPPAADMPPEPDASVPQPGVQQPPGAVAPPVGPVPTGSFDPHAQADVTIWAHDDSALAGHTYRYKLRYYIRNPVYQTQNVCNPQTLANTWRIMSKESVWTDAISIKSETNFFAINTNPARAVVKFEIFRWKNGAWQMQSTEAGPGDMVGAAQGDGANKIDFTTGLTMVDVRPDPRNPENRIILLTSDNGQIVRHDLSADRNSEEYKKLKDLMNAANKPAGAAAAATP